MDKKSKLVLIGALVLVAILVVGLAIAKPRGRAAKACRDGQDNDGDSYIDWPDDPGCSSKNDNSELNPAIECDDGSDNDGDTFTDSADPGCTSPTDSSELGTTQCDDGTDNADADTLVDYPDDSGCTGPSDNDEVNGQCDDTADNDLDSHTDYYGDSECTSYSDNDESPRDFCNDSDGGLISGTQGTASGEDDGVSFSQTDFCLDATNLREYYCGGLGYDYDWISIDINCYTGNSTTICSNGACV